MATIQELKQIKQQLRKTPLAYHAEIVNCWIPFNDSKDKLKSSYNLNDAKIALIKECLKIWDGGEAKKENIDNLFNTDYDPEGYIQACLVSCKSLKGGSLGSYYMEGYIKRKRAMPEIYEDGDNEITQLEVEKKALTDAKVKAEQEKETWKTNSEGWQKAVEERDKAIKERDSIITTAQTNLKTANEKIATLTNESNGKDTTIADLKHTIKDKEKIIDDNKDLPEQVKSLSKQLSDKDIELGKRNETITSITNENQTLKEQSTQSDKYLNKLLKIYREQITEATQAFYLNDLGLDESEDIRPKYKVDYLMRLNKLNGDIDPEQTINAFKIVALICATDKAQKISDKWINSSISKNKIFRESKLKYFNNIKKYWEINKGIISSTGEENNPLFLFTIDTQDFSRKQMENIITLWQ